jgi:anti-sigma regulatory factor (Ser/Thr protein kinase)
LGSRSDGNDGPITASDPTSAEAASWSFRGDDSNAIGPLRREIVAHLRRQAANHADLGGAAVVIGELLSNVVKHAPGPASVHLDWSGARPVVEVRDTGSGFRLDPRLPQPSNPTDGGRGLFLVAALACSIAVAPRPTGGSCVRAELPVERTG